MACNCEWFRKVGLNGDCPAACGRGRRLKPSKEGERWLRRATAAILPGKERVNEIRRVYKMMVTSILDGGGRARANFRDLVEAVKARVFAAFDSAKATESGRSIDRQGRAGSKRIFSF